MYKWREVCLVKLNVRYTILADNGDHVRSVETAAQRSGACRFLFFL
jgi:hypothetical protein